VFGVQLDCLEEKGIKVYIFYNLNDSKKRNLKIILLIGDSGETGEAGYDGGPGIKGYPGVSLPVSLFKFIEFDKIFIVYF